MLFRSVPHFEKMLYDQATLLAAYTHAYQVTGADHLRRVIESTVGYVLRDLATDGPGWASAEDADSEGIEGRFYLWSPDDVAAVCADPATTAAVCEWFGVGASGNFTDPHTGFTGTILTVRDVGAEPPPVVAAAIPALLAARARRVRPGLDDKVLLAWNAWFLRSLVEAAQIGRAHV